jgi:hypothetical protein
MPREEVREETGTRDWFPLLAWQRKTMKPPKKRPEDAQTPASQSSRAVTMLAFLKRGTHYSLISLIYVFLASLDTKLCARFSLHFDYDAEPHCTSF